MNRKAYVSILAFVFLAFVFLTGCNNSSSKPPVETMTLQSGSPQSTAGGTAFAASLIVQVTTGGSPTSGVSVTFTAPSSGASGTFANGTATETDTTDINGLATSSQFTANTTTGAYTVAATASGLPTVNFSLTNTAVPASITATSGTPQSAFVLTAFTNPLVATVLDASSNPVSGVSVVFTAPASGASGTFASTSTNTETDTTDASGNATSSAFTANGAVGAYSVTAAVTGVTPSATFALTNTTGGTAVGITATSGTPQSAVISVAFAAPLVANVTTGGVPTQGLSVTFTAPTTGASGTFASNSTNTETVITDASGNATSSVFTANATTGAYVVAATVADAVAPANFSLTNTPAPTSFTYTFYLSGLDVQATDGSGPYFYALAGAVTVDPSGNGLADTNGNAGEQDYNDGVVVSQTDTIAAGTAALVVDPTTGQGTLTLTTTDTNVGVAGVETLGVQFVNTNHALIVQFDGSATSSGSLDLQTGATTAPSGGYAFALSGVDTGYNPEVSGGVFTITGTTLSGDFDINDNGTVGAGNALNGTLSAPDSYGRGTITGIPAVIATTLSYYIVGPEVLRIIDVDPITIGDANIGSAFGQGTSAGSFGNASVGPSVFGIQSNSYEADSYAAAGMFTTTPSAGSFAGFGDDNEPFGLAVTSAAISGTYGASANGYGALSITAGLGDVFYLGMYMTDPALNLLDPNNLVGGGGALIVELDTLPGTGVLIPQTDTAPADFTGNYAFGAQDFNSSATFWEFDLVGQGSVTAGATNVLAGTANVSDPGGFFNSATPEETAAVVAATATPDGTNVGRFTIPALAVTVTGGTEVDLSAVIYQASGGQLFWLGEDATDVFLGPIEVQGSLTGIPGTGASAAKKAKTNKKRTK